MKLLLKCLFLSAVAGALPLLAQTVQFTQLAVFDNTNGSIPETELVLGSDGCFYGTTKQYTENVTFPTTNYGTVFKVTTNGTLTLLASFAKTNGWIPNPKLVLASDGCYYSTTQQGGTNNGNGTIYKVTTNGILTSLYSFPGTGGQYPGDLVLRSNFFYSTTSSGGANGYGIAFRATTNGVVTVLTNYDVTLQGIKTLTMMDDGTIYGTSCGKVQSAYYGTMFKFATNGVSTVLANFSPYYGENPSNLHHYPMAIGPNKVFYGTTPYGGLNHIYPGYGTVYSVTTNGAMSFLYAFTNTSPLQAYPGPLTLGNDGNLYGVIGANSGSIFRITTNGAYTTLFAFDAASTNRNGFYTNVSGAFPNKLTQGSDGSFYGTTQEGGPTGFGTVFKLTILPPPPIPLNYQALPGMVTLSWTNPAFSLQSAPQVAGTYTNIPGATSPFTNPFIGSQQFFRLIAN